VTPTELSVLVRKCLDEGSSVEIDGLGVFRPNGDGGWEFIADMRPQVFVAYVSEDRQAVDQLCADLEARGLEPWTDRRKLLPGQNWPRAIERAIEVSRFFIACLSKRSVSKRGRFQAEMRYALQCASLVPLSDAFFIPVRLDDCPVPLMIARQTQYIDLFPNWNRGIERIVQMARKQLRDR
jgi:hypothetical protein